MVALRLRIGPDRSSRISLLPCPWGLESLRFQLLLKLAPVKEERVIASPGCGSRFSTGPHISSTPFGAGLQCLAESIRTKVLSAWGLFVAIPKAGHVAITPEFMKLC